MGFTDLFDKDKREQARLHKIFEEEFARLRNMIEETEAAKKFIQDNSKQELPSTESVAKAREEILENNTYLILSKGDFESQKKRLSRAPDEAHKQKRALKSNGPRKNWAGIDCLSEANFKEWERLVDNFSSSDYIETFNMEGHHGTHKLNTSAKLAKQHAEMGVRVPNTKHDLRYKYCDNRELMAHCVTQAVCLKQQAELDAIQALFDDDIAHLRAMLLEVTEAIASVIQVHEEIDHLRSHLNQEQVYDEDLEDIEKTDKDRSLLLESIYLKTS